MKLTSRQQKILEALCFSSDNMRVVAEHLGLSYTIVNREQTQILNLTGAGTRLELLHMAISQKLIKCPFCGPKESV